MRIKACVSGACYVVLASATFAAEGETVTAEKKSGVQGIVDNSFASLELTHATDRKMEGDKVVDDVPVWEFEPTIGTTLFDGKLTTAFTWKFTKKPDSVRLEKKSLYNETVYDLYSGDYGNFKPYAYIVQSDGLSFSSAYLGFIADKAKSFEMPGGTLKISAYTLPLVQFTSGKAKSEVEVRNETEIPDSDFSLTANADEKTTTIEQRDPYFEGYLGGGISFTPGQLKDLTVGLAIDIARYWDPDYIATGNADDVDVRLDGYDVSTNTTTDFKISYKINDKLRISNSLEYKVDGLYERGLDGYRWENELSLYATIF